MTRHPYSFLGDSTSANGKRDEKATWHDGLLGYVGGDEAKRDESERRLTMQGREAGIEFDYSVRTHWQPIDSQRLLLWAGRYGLQARRRSLWWFDGGGLMVVVNGGGGAGDSGGWCGWC